MFFLISLLYIALFYILPGQFLLTWLAPKLTVVPETIALLILNLAAYLLVATIVFFTRFAEQDLDGDRIKKVRIIKAWLSPAGTRSFSLLTLLLLITGVVWQGFHGALPVETWTLYAALAVGTLSTLRGTPLIVTESELPKSNHEKADESLLAGEDTEPHHFTWQYSFPGKSGNAYRFRETFDLAPDWEEGDIDKTFQISSLDGYAILPTASASPSIVTVARWFRGESAKRGFSPTEELSNVVAFIRSLSSDTGTSFPSPLDASSAHRMLTKGGDSSEVRVILAATLLYQLGHDVALLYHHTEDGGFLSLAWRGELPTAFCIEDDDGNRYGEITVVPDKLVGRTPPSRKFTEGLKHHRIIPLPPCSSGYSQASDR